jgi:hypothetical protein
VRLNSQIALAGPFGEIGFSARKNRLWDIQIFVKTIMRWKTKFMDLNKADIFALFIQRDF